MNFDLSKTSNMSSDVGSKNERNIRCKFCPNVLIWQGTATKCQNNVSLETIYNFQVDLIKNNLREFEPLNSYWHVSDLKHFNNVMIHQMQGDLKYLSCLGCQSSIIGYQIISQPDKIYVSCDRVKLENAQWDGQAAGDSQFQDEFGDGAIDGEDY